MLHQPARNGKTDGGNKSSKKNGNEKALSKLHSADHDHSATNSHQKMDRRIPLLLIFHSPHCNDVIDSGV